jgi:hypothetical protein
VIGRFGRVVENFGEAWCDGSGLVVARLSFVVVAPSAVPAISSPLYEERPTGGAFDFPAKSRRQRGLQNKPRAKRFRLSFFIYLGRKKLRRARWVQVVSESGGESAARSSPEPFSRKVAQTLTLSPAEVAKCLSAGMCWVLVGAARAGRVR